MATTSVNFPVQVIAGNYVVRLIDPLTNMIFDEWVNIISIIEPPLLIASSNSITSNLCTGDSNASEQLVISGGVQPYALVLNSSSADFSPTVNVSLSNTLCNTLADLSIIVSQDPGEVDMLTALFESNIGQFDMTSNNLSLEVLGNDKDFFIKGVTGSSARSASISRQYKSAAIQRCVQHVRSVTSEVTLGFPSRSPPIHEPN